MKPVNKRFRSGTSTKSVVVINSDAPHMSEVVIRHTDWLQSVYARVHVETGLDIILWYALLFKLSSSPTHRVRQGFILLGHPATLNASFLFLVALFLSVLTKHSCNGLDSLLKLYLSVVASRDLLFDELRLSPVPGVMIVLLGVLFFEL